MTAASEEWIGEVIGFWFAELGRSRWFEKDADIDPAIRDRFLRPSVSPG